MVKKNIYLFSVLLLAAILAGVVWLSSGIIEILNIKPSPSAVITPQITAPTTSGDKPEDLKFAVMSDIHSDLKHFRQALEKSKNDEMEFVILNGDLTTLGNKNELLAIKEAADKSGVKYYVVPGNHDMWAEHKENKRLFWEVFGTEYQSFSAKGVKFILFNNSDWLDGAKRINPVTGEKQWVWLEKELQECPKITCLVFAHEPLNHPVSDHIMGEDSKTLTEQGGELKRVLTEAKIKQMFSGHLHFANEYSLDGIKTKVSGAITSERNWQSSKFVEVTVSGGIVETKDVFAD